MSDTTNTPPSTSAPVPVAAQGQTFAEYGGKRFPTNGAALEEVKRIMARFFPELAEPKVETKNENGSTIYVFTKQAGRKGAGQGAAQTAKIQAALRRVRAQPLSRQLRKIALGGKQRNPVSEAAQAVFGEPRQVAALHKGLGAMQADIELTGDGLL